MICKSCGTAIADKALICYRCGKPTSDLPARPVAPPRRRVPRVVSLLALLALVGAALFLGQAGEIDLPPTVSYSLATVVALILVWRLWRRRRR